MKKNLASIEISYIVKELNELIDSKLDKIYHIGKNVFLFQFHITGKGKKILRISVPDYLFITDYKGEAPETPSQFCMILRKNLEQARLRSIKQLHSERIIELLFEKQEKRKVFIELFNQGNLLICDENDVIISALLKKKWKDRTIRGGIKYEFPKREIDFFDLNEKELENLFKNTQKDSIVTCLAIELGLGGTYAEEVCLLAGVEKKAEPKQAIKKIDAILKSVMGILNKKTKANYVINENEIIDIVPFELDNYKSFDKKYFKSYNEAADSYFSAEIKKTTKASNNEAYENDIKKIEKIISEQEKKIRMMQDSINENSKKAELIYSNYNLMKEIIEEIRKARKKYSWKEIKEKLKNHSVIKEINEKEGKITIEIK
ncbi:MAG: NFACT family protein [Candidatus Nanoarchaeia archaeon]|nr:NFACT family protein [Candidatus Nanoarchaeia archaeon]